MGLQVANLLKELREKDKKLERQINNLHSQNQCFGTDMYLLADMSEKQFHPSNLNQPTTASAENVRESVWPSNTFVTLVYNQNV